MTHQTASGSSSGKGRLAAVCSRLAEGQQFLDDEPGRVQLGRGGARRVSGDNRERLRWAGSRRAAWSGSSETATIDCARRPDCAPVSRKTTGIAGRAAPGGTPAGRTRPRVSAISSSCVPRWTTRPPERTMISSQSRIVRQPVGDDQAGAAPAAEVVVDDAPRSWGRARWWPRRGSSRLGSRTRAPGDLQPLALAAREVPRLSATAAS